MTTDFNCSASTLLNIGFSNNYLGVGLDLGLILNIDSNTLSIPSFFMCFLKGNRTTINESITS